MTQTVHDFDYHILANLNLNIRVSRDRLVYNQDDQNDILMRIPEIEYAQANLDTSDMEDMLEVANSVADTVNLYLYHKEGSERPDMTREELNATRADIASALITLIAGLSNPDIIEKNVEHLTRASEDSLPIDRFTYTSTDDNYETRVFIHYVPENILATNPIYMKRPGALVNTYTKPVFVEEAALDETAPITYATDETVTPPSSLTF